MYMKKNACEEKCMCPYDQTSVSVHLCVSVCICVPAPTLNNIEEVIRPGLLYAHLPIPQEILCLCLKQKHIIGV